MLLDYPPAIRRAIYTTHAIEALNYSLRKVLKGRGAFPNDEAIVQLLYMGLQHVAQKWTQPLPEWKAALNQFVILFGERVPRGKSYTLNLTTSWAARRRSGPPLARQRAQMDVAPCLTSPPPRGHTRKAPAPLRSARATDSSRPQPPCHGASQIAYAPGGKRLCRSCRWPSVAFPLSLPGFAM